MLWLRPTPRRGFGLGPGEPGPRGGFRRPGRVRGAVRPGAAMPSPSTYEKAVSAASAAATRTPRVRMLWPRGRGGG
jgi:hypothetical protein